MAARLIATVLGIGIARRTRATLALSGGSSPLPMLGELVRQPLDWKAIHVFQVDERIVARGDAARNLTNIEEMLVTNGPLPRRNLHPMWVDRADLLGSAAEYASGIEQLAGVPAVLDAVHLGLGTDGHTASLFPGSPVEVDTPTVAVTANYQDRPARRVSLTPLVINAARRAVFLVSGQSKSETLARILHGEYQPDQLPAQRIRPTDGEVIWLVDEAAAGKL